VLRHLAVFGVVLSTVMSPLTPVLAQEPAPQPAAAPAGDGPVYNVSQILLDFAADLPVHPPSQQLMGLEVKLGKSDTGYTAPGKDGETLSVRLAEVPKLPTNQFHASALKAIAARVVAHFAEWGYTGIVVEPNKDDIKGGKDIRPEGQTALRLVIRTDGTWTGVPGRPDEVVTQPSYTVTQFIPTFAPDVPRRPPLSEVMKYTVDLSEVGEGYVGPSPGRRPVRIRLADVASLPKHAFYPSAINTIAERLEKHLADRGFKDLQVIPHPQDINEAGVDVRFPNQTALRLLVRIAPPAPELPPAPTEPVVAETPAPAPMLVAVEESDGQLYAVSQVIVEYAETHPAHPDLLEVMTNAAVYLAETEKGYVAATPEEPGKVVRLADIPLLSKPYLYGSAIQSISRAIVSDYSRRGYIGINVAPHPEDIDNTATDVRAEGITALRMLVRIGIVTEVRTVAAGDRVEQEERINNPLHERIMERSPVRPGDAGDPDRPDLLRKKDLDNYISWLNRHPTRRVDVSVSPATQPGGVALDYLITEAKPWMVYAQVSNTGTDQTDEWRERFGFAHHQLTNNDDTLTVDYITASFDSAHSVLASYEAPLFDAERLRWMVQANWSQYTASDVGFALERFEGEEWGVEGNLIYNIYQRGEFFIDAIAGLRWQADEVDSVIIDVQGEADFLLPHAGFQMERYTETSSTFGLVDFEINLQGNSQEDLDALGRLFADDEFWRMRYDVTHSFFLEPILNSEAWLDASTPETSTLAHEIAVSLKGQYTTSRNPPQFERTVGGLYSVRGYEESVTAGDTVLIASLEYRFHIPRILPLNPDPGTLFGQPFRWAPQQVYGRPDWDFIVRAFFDYGKVWNNDRLNVETDFDLMSVGVGAELLIKRNFNVRVDWGYVLEELENRVKDGDSRFHIVATFLY
jgi:hemolysin activation/secretion protein